jgi:hypothetical protein
MGCLPPFPASPAETNIAHEMRLAGRCDLAAARSTSSSGPGRKRPGGPATPPPVPGRLDGGCPILSRTLRTMRTKHYLEALRQDTDRLVASFGSAHLVRTQAGRLEVQGGTETDHADAWDWVQRFLTLPTIRDGVHTLSG